MYIECTYLIYLHHKLCTVTHILYVHIMYKYNLHIILRPIQLCKYYYTCYLVHGLTKNLFHYKTYWQELSNFQWYILEIKMHQNQRRYGKWQLKQYKGNHGSNYFYQLDNSRQDYPGLFPLSYWADQLP